MAAASSSAAATAGTGNTTPSVDHRVRGPVRKVTPAPFARICGLRFGVMTEEEVQRMSVVQLTNTTGGANRDKLAPAGSPMDARLGSPEPQRIPCNYCFDRDCAGHWSCIELPFPILHPSFFQYTLSLLRMFCWGCGALVLDRQDRRLRDLDMRYPVGPLHQRVRFSKLSLIADSKRAVRTCPAPNCGLPQPMYTKRSKSEKCIVWKFSHEHRVMVDSMVDPAARLEMDRPLNTVRMRRVLASVRREDLVYVGLGETCHPEAWLPRVIPVLPIPQRPTIPLVELGNVSTVDDLTKKSNALVRMSEEAWCVVNRQRFEAEQVLTDALYDAERRPRSSSAPPRPAAKAPGDGDSDDDDDGEWRADDGPKVTTGGAAASASSERTPAAPEKQPQQEKEEEEESAAAKEMRRTLRPCSTPRVDNAVQIILRGRPRRSCTCSCHHRGPNSAYSGNGGGYTSSFARRRRRPARCSAACRTHCVETVRHAPTTLASVLETLNAQQKTVVAAALGTAVQDAAGAGGDTDGDGDDDDGVLTMAQFSRRVAEVLDHVLPYAELQRLRRKAGRTSYVPKTLSQRNPALAITIAPFSATFPAVAVERMPLTAAEMDAFMRMDRGRALWESAQVTFAVLVCNAANILGRDRGGAFPFRSLMERLVGKKGFWRACVNCKRCDFTSRGMIGPASNDVAMEEIGIPEEVARTMTRPEVVTDANRARLEAAVLVGPGRLGGASRLGLMYGQTVDLRFGYETREQRAALLPLRPGHTVHRHLVNGDPVLFNRAPTMDPRSIQTRRARIVEGHTYRLNLGYTSDFHADFDGDEGTTHYPQGSAPAAEAATLTDTYANFLGNANGLPASGPVLNDVTGVALLARPDRHLRHAQMRFLADGARKGSRDAASVKVPPPALQFPGHRTATGRPENVWTGVQAFNLCIPSSTASYCVRVHTRVPHQSDAELAVGGNATLVASNQLVCGPVDAAVLAKSHLSLLHVFARYGAPQVACEFLNRLQSLVDRFNEHLAGLTLTMDDVALDADKLQAIDDEVAAGVRAMEEVERYARSLTGTGATAHALPERAVEAAVGRVHDALVTNVNKIVMAGIVRAGPRANRVWRMHTVGAKGTAGNMLHIVGLLGQQMHQGRRLCPDAGGRDGRFARISSGFALDDASPAARGFVGNAYLRGKGLNVVDFLAASEKQRGNIVHMSTKTAESGYEHAKLVIHNEACRAVGGGTLAPGVAVQNYYGGDGLNPKKLQCVYVRPLLQADDAELAGLVERASGPADVRAGGAAVRRDLTAWLRRARNTTRRQHGGLACPGLPTTTRLPFDGEILWKRVVGDALEPQGKRVEAVVPEAVAPERRVTLRDALLVPRIFARWFGDSMSPAALVLLQYYAVYHLLARLAASDAGVDRGLGHEYVLQMVLHTAEARVPDGAAVGVWLGQSIGKPNTQNKLDAKHDKFDAQAHTATTVREILSNASMRHATMLVPLRHAPASAAATGPTPEQLGSMVRVPLRVLAVAPVRVHFDPVRSGAPWSELPEDAALLERAARFFTSEFRLKEDSGWVPSPYIVRVAVDAERATRRYVTPRLVAEAIEALLGSIACTVVYDPETCLEQWTFRVRCWSPQAEDPGRLYAPAKALTEDTAHTLRMHLQNQLSAGGLRNVAEATLVDAEVPVVDRATGAWAVETRRAVRTRGSNLRDLAKHPWVDWANTLTTDVHDMHATLGLFAARDLMVHLLSQILVKGNTAALDPRHLQTLVDHMACRNGAINPNTCSGFQCANASVGSQIMFERQWQALMNSAVFERRDDLDSVKSSILTASAPPIGTGAVGVAPPDAEASRAVPRPRLQYAARQYGRLVHQRSFRSAKARRESCLRWVGDDDQKQRRWNPGAQAAQTLARNADERSRRSMQAVTQALGLEDPFEGLALPQELAEAVGLETSAFDVPSSSSATGPSSPPDTTTAPRRAPSPHPVRRLPFRTSNLVGTVLTTAVS